ncbi:YeeE/YedE family protein [Aliigemmobacter aestuarii]|uniref:YeeE/YedE family protein n=1 Tax=Aliigemmobacter aestuarii TaxID=1445661 RepID=A0A4S3MLR9_9RHOB|nr:YeeE/YedE thiosulfate transporter family protein [Gemmobacter aestuarii]THD83178.1 YeeE/YedE family protein [Gemmobacter aestuarii]
MPTDWIWGFVGGLMIGGAAALYLLMNGRIMGASGILGGLVDGTGRDAMVERLAFLFGAMAVPPLLVPLYDRVDTQITSNAVVIIAAGLLVGVGTRLANGCTSGHGVCGISRLAPRGLASTALYLLGGAVAVLVFRHMLGVI